MLTSRDENKKKAGKSGHSIAQRKMLNVHPQNVHFFFGDLAKISALRRICSSGSDAGAVRVKEWTTLIRKTTPSGQPLMPTPL
jgi:hypothetical protein